MYKHSIVLIKSLCVLYMKLGMSSSRHGPNKPGYSCATMVHTKRSNSASWSKSLKGTLVRIVGCNSPT